MTAKKKAEVIHDVAVIGAGPSGLTAALLFAQKGLNTLLLAPEVNHTDGRTTALLQESVSLLESLGVWETLGTKAAPLRRMRLIDDTGRLIRAPEVTFDSAELELDAYGYNLLNIDLNSALEQAADRQQGLTFVRRAAAAYDFSETEVAIKDTDGALHKARLAVAADGRESKLREAAGIDVRRWSYPQVALVLNLDHDLPHGDVSTEFHTPTGPFTLVPLPGRSSSLVCVETAETVDRLMAMSDGELALELERRAHSTLGKFKIATKPQKFPLSGLNAKSLVAHRVALIGETAHVFPPIGAQGLNLSLRDVAALGRIIKAAHDRDQDIGSVLALGAYEKERRADISSRTAAVDALNRSLLNGFLPVQLARSAGLYLAGRVGPFRRLLMREGIAPGTKSSAGGLFPKKRSA